MSSTENNVKPSLTLWESLVNSGASSTSEDEYQHGYKRDVRSDLKQYVAFSIDDETYAVSIDRVEEIAQEIVTVPVPRTSDFVVGVGNVRGRVLPIVNLCRRLRLPREEEQLFRRTLIVNSDGEFYGLLVDRVVGVIEIAPENLEIPPGAIGGTRAEYIEMLGRSDEQIIILLNLQTVLNPRDFVTGRGRKVSP